jgi:hypothetical protein
MTKHLTRRNYTLTPAIEAALIDLATSMGIGASELVRLAVVEKFERYTGTQQDELRAGIQQQSGWKLGRQRKERKEGE